MSDAQDQHNSACIDCVEKLIEACPSLFTQQVYHTAASKFDSSSLIILGVTDKHVFYKVNVYLTEKRSKKSCAPFFFSALVDDLVEYAQTLSPYDLAKVPSHTLSDITKCYTEPQRLWDDEHGVKGLVRRFDQFLLRPPIASHGKGDTLAVAWEEFLIVLKADNTVLHAFPIPKISKPLQKQIRLGKGFVALGMEHIGDGTVESTPSVVVFPFSTTPTTRKHPFQLDGKSINMKPRDELLCIEVCDETADSTNVSSVYVFYKREEQNSMREVRYDTEHNNLLVSEDCTFYQSLPFVPFAVKMSEDMQVLSILDTKTRIWLLSHEGITLPLTLIVGGEQRPFFKDFRVFHEFDPIPSDNHTNEEGFVIADKLYGRVYVVLLFNTGVVRFRAVSHYEEKVLDLKKMLCDQLSEIPQGIDFLEEACYDSAHLVDSIAISPKHMCLALETQQIVCMLPSEINQEYNFASSSLASSSAASSY